MLRYVVAEWVSIEFLRMVIDSWRIEKLDAQSIKYETDNKSRNQHCIDSWKSMNEVVYDTKSFILGAQNCSTSNEKSTYHKKYYHRYVAKPGKNVRHAQESSGARHYGSY